MPLIIGVTGSIATGKSLLCRRLADRHGAIHEDADTVVHRMYESGKPAFGRIVAEFGADVVGADGRIDRKVLGSKVFGDDERMAALRTAIGDIPAEVHAIFDRWRATLAADAIAVMEAVNLIENHYVPRCDVVWLVASEDEAAIVRLMQRNQLDRAEAEQRLASARDWRDRADAAHHVFHNDATLGEFEAEIDRVFGETRDAFAAGELP